MSKTRESMVYISDFACKSFHPEFTPTNHLHETGRPFRTTCVSRTV